ncbi:MAG TPA: peptidoglycan DD-metalloendopeptidase family protein [Desulfurivibrionaceae bacterium]|nr:peptidoglycan DD-metalloendopeptidase family protein [Desulfurivibrionaceae bacterium]
MAKKLHFMVTSERGETKTFTLTTRTIKGILAGIGLVVVGSTIGWGLSAENVSLRARTLAARSELASVQQQNQEILAKAARQEREQKALLDTALNELRQRTQTIESILSTVGVGVEIKESRANAGGPYRRLPDDSIENLTFKVDHYLKTVQSLPLGSPVGGAVSSVFGRRIDPVNGLAAFHEGVDIRNERGTKVKAPAAGRVIQCGFDGGHGNFILLDHGNHFRTRYFHLQKSLVRPGDSVKRGEAIGLVGNTGRSTGPHLHYEVSYRDRPLDPLKFMRIASYMKERRHGDATSVR